MSSSQVSQVRLAPLDQAGSTVYNSYQFLSQIAGLYTYGGESDEGPDRRAEWRWLCDSVVDDLGVLYTVWESAIKVAATDPPGMIALSLGQRVVRSCDRTDLLARHLTLWTPLFRWLRLLRLLELRWQGFLTAMVPPLANLPVSLEPLQEGARARLAKLELLMARDLSESECINACFDLVAQGNQ